MAILKFPPVTNADESGLLALGGDLDVSSLVLAYSQGIFPWPSSDYEMIPWYSPDPRGILEFKNLHISHSLKKLLRQKKFEVRFNEQFEKVILNCAHTHHKKGQTWITPKMMEAYINLHYAGYAYSAETYQEGKLVGGVYGVRIKNYICGESMFHHTSNASKVALVTLIQQLHTEGVTWMDTQMVTPVVESLGGELISREIFMQKLNIL